jgi:tetratricopeptide (TPR) repeat protein
MPCLRALAQRIKHGDIIFLCGIFFGAATIFLALAPASARGQEVAKSSTLRGAVQDSLGKPAAGVALYLRAKDAAQAVTTRTDEHGRYSFAGLREGVYVLRAEMSGGAEAVKSSATVSSISLGPQEAKEIDLTLGAAESSPSQLHASSAPDFFDQPQFTVSGVTDTTSQGGHGSDTVVRTGEALAKETASLAKAPTGRPPAASLTSEEVLRAKVDHNPHDFAANHDLGEFLLSRGNARDAISYLNRAAEINPADYDNAYDLALANDEAGNYVRARGIAQALLVHHDKAELHHLLAEAQEKLGNSLEAVNEYQRASALNPSEPYIFDWGSELLLHHAPEPAFEVFSKGNSLFPRSVRMLIGIGATSFARGSYDQAVEKICAASDLNPRDPTPYLFLGKIESSQAVPPEALLEKLRQFVTLEPENAEANYYYAVGLWKRRETPPNSATVAEVESLLTKAVHLDTKFSPAYLQLGIVHSDQEHFSQAISDYQQALQTGEQAHADTGPDSESAHYRLAQAYRHVGEADKAKAESLLYSQAAKESAQQAEQERREIRQFVYTLRDQPATQRP